MYELQADRQLQINHALRFENGELEPVHAHDWRVSVCVGSNRLNTIGLVMDFNELLRIVDDVLEPLQGQYMNALPMFQDVNPSSEHAVDYIFEAILPKLTKDVWLERVTITRKEPPAMRFSRQRTLSKSP